MRGYVIYKEMEDQKRDITINIMEKVMGKMIYKHQMDLRIRLWPVYKRYMKIKTRKEEIKRKKEMDKMAK